MKPSGSFGRPQQPSSAVQPQQQHYSQFASASSFSRPASQQTPASPAAGLRAHIPPLFSGTASTTFHSQEAPSRTQTTSTSTSTHQPQPESQRPISTVSHAHRLFAPQQTQVHHTVQPSSKTIPTASFQTRAVPALFKSASNSPASTSSTSASTQPTTSSKSMATDSVASVFRTPAAKPPRTPAAAASQFNSTSTSSFSPSVSASFGSIPKQSTLPTPPSTSTTSPSSPQAGPSSKIKIAVIASFERHPLLASLRNLGCIITTKPASELESEMCKPQLSATLPVVASSSSSKPKSMSFFVFNEIDLLLDCDRSPRLSGMVDFMGNTHREMSCFAIYIIESNYGFKRINDWLLPLSTQLPKPVMVSNFRDAAAIILQLVESQQPSKRNQLERMMQQLNENSVSQQTALDLLSLIPSSNVTSSRASAIQSRSAILQQSFGSIRQIALSADVEQLMAQSPLSAMDANDVAAFFEETND